MTENEAIQFLDNIKHAEAGRAIGKDGFYAELMGYHVEALNMAIKALEQEQKWIPVSERLPYNHEYRENNGLFNVSDGNRTYSEWFDIYDTQKFGEPTMYGFRVDHAVIAWMPLPKPYEPQESEE